MLFCPQPSMKRLSWSSVVLAALCALACARREATPAPGATLSRHLFGDAATLDPTTTTEEASLTVEALIFRPLLGIDAQRRPAPALARSWTVSPDGLVYEFRLDPKATWEDGSPVTSDDVRFTIERVRDPKVNAATWSAAFDGLAAIETPDPLTVRVRFQRPYAERLFAFNLPIVSARAFARAKGPVETDRQPFGSGPYRLASWDANRTIRLARREGVPSSEAAFSEIVFRIIPDQGTAFQAGIRGELDEFRVLRDQIRAAQTSADFGARNRLLKVPQFVEVMVIWNCRHPFLQDARVRRALALTWPRAEASSRLYPPDGATLVSGPYPPGIPENDPDVAPPVPDLAEAGRLLDAAGWKAGPDGVRRKNGKVATFDLMVRANSKNDGNLAEILRSAYEKVGVVLRPRPLDWAAFSERAEAGEFDAHLTGRLFLPPNVDPYPYFHSTQGPPKGQNLGYYSNPEADKLMEAARVELDPDRRIELYRRIHRALAADPPADFLWGADQYWGISKRVEGVEVSALGLFHFLPGPLGWRPAPAAVR
jgi:peptide/nickel transport system substrate-binding protein